MKSLRGGRRVFVASVLVAGSLLCGGALSLLAVCGPFTDVAADAFCPFVLEIFYSGITTGTTPTTYDPASPVSRLQMAAFLSRTVDGVLRRGGERAALKRFWSSQNNTVLGLTTLAASPQFTEFDGEDVGVSHSSGSISRVHASDGRLLGTWTGATGAQGVLSAMGKVFVTGLTNPGKLYQIDPSQPAGAVTTVATNLGLNSRGIAFDGSRIWTANIGQSNSGGSVSIITPGATLPWSVTTVSTGFSTPEGSLFDGANIWVTDQFAGTLLKLSSTGSILQTVTFTPGGPRHPAFDGTNIWVPTNNGRIAVVRASSGAILSTLSNAALGSGFAAAFDGQRILITHDDGSMISLWKAADLTPLGTVDPGGSTSPMGVCSDGLNFWIALGGPGQLARF
jgi:hypothetical protein